MKRIIITVGIFLFILTGIAVAKPVDHTYDKELWDDVYYDKGTSLSWSVEVANICYSTAQNCYGFLIRSYNKKKDEYIIYSAYWWPNLYDFDWYKRWQGSEKTNRKTALEVRPEYANYNTVGNEITTKKLPLKPWQEAVINYVILQAEIEPEFLVTVNSVDEMPLLPNYPYHKNLRR